MQPTVGLIGGSPGYNYKSGPAADPLSLSGLVASGRIFFVHQRTKVGVIGQSGNYIRVRILEGIHQGRTGWVSKGMYYGPGEDPDAEIKKYIPDGIG